MSRFEQTSPRLQTLLQAACRDDAAEDELAELEELAADESALCLVADYLQLDGELHRIYRQESSVDRCLELVGIDIDGSPPNSDHLVLPFPVLASQPASSTAVFGHFSSGWPVAYMIAAIIFGVGLTIGALVHVSAPTRVVQPSSPLPSSLSPLPSAVARITEMVDCEWEESGFRVQDSGAADYKSEIPYRKSLLHLGDRLALKSGLLELTYDTGAKVILQGPVSYEVESPAGGYLSIGKLTARLNSRSEIPDPQSQISNLKSQISNRQFAVRTPTAVVTDLGTEFGVEVDGDGQTTSHVFRGSVNVRVAGTHADEDGIEIVLRANESSRTENARNGTEPTVVLRRIAFAPQRFVRRIARPPHSLDLLDIVAGGNGVGHRRERGIDPTKGMEDVPFMAEDRKDQGGYHRVLWGIRLIDGVFVPNGGDGPVVLDSAGHTFDGFPRTAANVFGSIWARAASVRSDDRANNPQYWVYKMGRGDEFMPNDGGLLGFHPNAGITFNLDAMRRMHPDSQPARFRAAAGVAHRDKAVDVWVFIDGHLKQKRKDLCQKDGVTFLDVTIGPHDRFLTLVATCGEDYRNAWFVLGEPVLEMVPGEGRR